MSNNFIEQAGKLISNITLPAHTLKSVDFTTLVEVLSEGEIEGSATAHKNGITDRTSAAYVNAFKKDLFLDNLPLVEADADVNNVADSDLNYKSVEFNFEFGTVNNKVLPAAEVQATERTGGDIGQEVSFPDDGSVTPRSVQITNTAIDKVRVRAYFPLFYRVSEDSGNRKTTSVQVLIKINPSNGSEQTIITELVEGKSTSAYNRDYGIILSEVPGYNNKAIGESGAFFPFTITLSRSTTEGDDNVFNKMRLGGVTEIIQESNNYPNVAYTSLRFSAEEFTSLPSRVFRVRGKRVKIPHNGTVELATGRITYTGTFNGSFKADKEWTSDPSWILYDLLIDDRYGCNLPESSLDKFVFRKASEYCGELVDDGQGGQEPRFSLNVNIREQSEALEVINDICSVMRAMPFYSEGTVKISQDAPNDFANPSVISYDYVFNNANVVDGTFEYSGSSLKTRFTTINVSYLDLETRELDYVTVKDNTAIAKYGETINTIRTFGTTSRGQAQRVGKWFLNTQQTATESCSFETNIAAGSIVQIGSIIGIADVLKSSARRGGIVKAVSSSQGNSNIDQVTIDNVVNTSQPDISDSPTISCLLTNGKVETKTIQSYSTDQTVVNVSSAFSSAPVVNSPYIFESASQQVSDWRIINIKETNKRTYVISALSHNQGKYAAVEDGEALPQKTVNAVVSLLPAPSGVTIEEKIVTINNRAVPKVFIDWDVVYGTSYYVLQYRRDDDNFTVIETRETSHEIIQTEFEAGSYTVRISAVNSLGKGSPILESTVSVDGLSAKPENPTGFEIEPINNYQVRLTWDKSIALDVVNGGRCLIRHTTASLANTKFSDATEIDNQNGNTTQMVAPAMPGTYAMKFEDLAGNLSITEAKVEFSLPETEDVLAIKQQREQSSFSGNKPSNHLSVVSGALQLTNPATSLTGTYEFANVLDLGAVYQNVRLIRHIKSEGFNISDDFDAIPLIDNRDNFDGEGSDRLKGRLKVQTSTNGSSYTGFLNLRNGSFVGRYFKFKSELISVDANENIKFTELGFDASLPSRTENKYISSGNVISTPIQSGTSATGVDIEFAKRFFTGTSDVGGSTTTFLPSVVIAPEDLPSGAYFVVSNISGTGFTVVFKNSSDAAIDVKFTFQALGYGKGA